jgi:hypothetical protein
MVRGESVLAARCSKFVVRRLPSSWYEFEFFLAHCDTHSTRLLSRGQRLPCRLTAGIVEFILLVVRPTFLN